LRQGGFFCTDQVSDVTENGSIAGGVVAHRRLRWRAMPHKTSHIPATSQQAQKIARNGRSEA
jgi:hypothetical protein